MPCMEIRWNVCPGPKHETIPPGTASVVHNVRGDCGRVVVLVAPFVGQFG
jgi:hypothetical protein